MLKQLGALYLILGTCIAAGLLGLPVVTASNNYVLSIAYVMSAWLLMSTGAWCLLQVNLWLPPGSNLISMSEATLGKTVKMITWGVYLLLLYSLICAYLAASGDILQSLLRDIHIIIPRTLATILAALSLGSIVYLGIRSVDKVNRLLMSVKIIICLSLILLVAPHATLSHLQLGNSHWHNSVWLVVICSFGYAIILPSIREYLDSNKKQLNRVVLIGSLVPMVLYLVWIAVIQGSLLRYGHHGLIAMNNAANTNSMLMNALAGLTHHASLKSISIVFISICSVTGLLGVSICLVDFLADGLKRPRQGLNKLLLVGITFTPPTLIVILKPTIFVHALAYAGLFCLYVLVGLPIAMYVVGKAKKSVSTHDYKEITHKND